MHLSADAECARLLPFRTPTLQTPRKQKDAPAIVSSPALQLLEDTVLICNQTELIDARGTTEPQGVSTMFFPVIENILANKSGGVSLSVEYPAALNQNTTSGEDFVIDTITAGLLSCPQQTYALFGYSQGASLMLNVLARLNSRALEAVTSVILAGNPYRVPGKISNVDETAQHDSSSSVGMFAAQAIASNSSSVIPQLAPEVDRSGKVLDYCIEVSLQSPDFQFSL